MQKLNLPVAPLVISEVEGRAYVFDLIRKKNILLTPEEWVRQHFLHFLIQILHYPKPLCSVERGLRYNKLMKRTDITVYDRKGNIFLVVECKAAHIPLSQKTLEQAATYSFSLKAKHLVVTNGLQNFCCKIDYEAKKYSFLENLPAFDQAEFT